ncbi:MAG: aminoglycoside phosphotransferase family protein [Actinomycetota bacterium]
MGFEVDPVIRRRASAAGADAWLDGIDGLVADLAAEWNLSVDSSPLSGGTEGVVLAATTADGRAGVLKLLSDADSAMAEITALARLGPGAGPALLQHDTARGALVIERLGPSMADLGIGPASARLPLLCAAAARVWRSPVRPADAAELMTGEAKARWLIDFVATEWTRLDAPCTQQALDHAITAAERRLAAHDDERSCLVHGDVHRWNALLSDRPRSRAEVDTSRPDRLRFTLVDPDGLWAEPAYDLGILMREDSDDLLRTGARHRAERLARWTGLDVDAIAEWGAIERVSTAFVALDIGLEGDAQQMLAAAELAATQGS